MTRSLSGAPTMAPRGISPSWLRRFATLTLAASLAPLVGVVPVASAGTEATMTTAPAETLSGPAPTISGTVRVGSKVAAKPGTWTSGTTFAYRWYASGQAISGATSASYTPTASVKGKTLKVRVIGSKSGYTTTSRTSAGVTVKAGVFIAVTPRIKGQVRTGATVSVARGTWTPSASRYRYKWRVDGVVIRGATGKKFTIPSTYAGRNLSVTVKGTRAGYTKKAVTSAGTRVARSYKRTGAPKIWGKALIGSTLKVGSHGTWKPVPSSWKYRWKANGVAISGATSRSFKLTSAQHGKKITVKVTAVRKGYYRTSRTSAATAAVGAPAPVLTQDGTYRVGTDIAPGTYVAASPTDDVNGCSWERRSTSGSSSTGVVASGEGYGQQIVTIKSTDEYLRTQGCGSWRKYSTYGSVRTSTAVDGMYKVGTAGGQLKPGLYSTSGSPIGFCIVVRYSNFSGERSSVVDFQVIEAFPANLKVYPTDVGFETVGCSWKLVSS